MKREEILRKAIEKAGTYWLPKHKEPLAEYVEFLLGDNEYYSIIFSHDFAKAFFGSKSMNDDDTPEWKIRLQEMVLEDDPVSYLAKFI